MRPQGASSSPAPSLGLELARTLILAVGLALLAVGPSACGHPTPPSPARTTATARTGGAKPGVARPQSSTRARPVSTQDRPRATQQRTAPGRIRGGTGSLAGRVVAIQPLGRRLSGADVREVAQALRIFYGVRVQVLARRPLPRAAYYRPRRRYRAEKLLTFLGRVGPKRAFRILGLTAADISTTKGRVYDWGIMGLATLDGRVCVISRFRCARGARSAAHARHRLAKTAVHEIGHTLGLEHCPHRGCLMEDARGTNRTSDREYVLCASCRAALARRGILLPPNPKPPWPRR